MLLLFSTVKLLHLMCGLNQVLCILAPKKVLNSCEVTVVLKNIIGNMFLWHLILKINNHRYHLILDINNQQSTISPYSRYQRPPKDILSLSHFYRSPSQLSHWNQPQQMAARCPCDKNLSTKNLSNWIQSQKCWLLRYISYGLLKRNM